MESGVEFVAVDMPEANKLTVHILAARAENEREQISARTKAALMAANCKMRQGDPEGKCKAVRRQRSPHHRGDQAKRHNKPQCDCRQAQRAQCSHGAGWGLDACAGRSDPSKGCLNH